MTLVTHPLQERGPGCTGELEGFEAGIPEDLEGAGNPLPATIQGCSHSSPLQCRAGGQGHSLVLQTRLWISCSSLAFVLELPHGIPRIARGWNSFRISNSIPAFGNHRVSSRCREGSRAPAVWGDPHSPGYLPGSRFLLTWTSRFPRAGKIRRHLWEAPFLSRGVGTTLPNPTHGRVCLEVPPLFA